MAKTTKKDARYTPEGTEQEHCSICRNFVYPDACKKVEGAVSREGWCRFFDKRRTK